MKSPKVRFKEFNDEWKSVELDNIFEFYNTNSLSRDQLSLSGSLKNLHYGDIHRKYNCIVDEHNEIESYVKDTNYINKYELIRENDLIFADASEDYSGIGKAVEVINVKNNTISGLHTIMAREKSKIFAPMFKGYYFNSPIVHNQLRILANGFKVYGISKKAITELQINIPSINEQEKIANTLYLLDKKIELHTEKIEYLKKFKKGIIKKLSSEISTTKKIKDICIYKNGSSYENNVDDEGIYYLISLNSVDIDGNLKIDMKKINYNNPETLMKNDIVMVLSDVAHGDFLGISSLIDENNKYVLNQRMGLLRITDDSIPEFIVEMINNEQKKFKKLGQGSSQLNLSKDDILNVKIKYPNVKTQKYYAEIFNRIKKYQNMNEEKLKELVELKKGLMQSMFV